MTVKVFTHPVIGEECGSISGHYSFIREANIVYRDREILYHTGYAITDSACCGTGGCVFCRVAGFVRKRLPGDVMRTEVEPVSDSVERREIEDILKKKEGCTQVSFF